MAPGREREIDELLAPVNRAFAELGVGRRDEELEAVAEFLSGAVRAMRDEASRLEERGRRHDVGRGGREALSAPVGSVAEATLDLAHGAWRISIGAEAGASLYRVGFETMAPKVTFRAGVLSIERPSLGVRSLLRVPENPPGARAARRPLERARGLEFPRPPGRRRHHRGPPASRGRIVRAQGRHERRDAHLAGAARHRPPPVHGRRVFAPDHLAGVGAYRITLQGGASGVVIDALRLGSVGGELKWASPSFDAATDRYDLTLAGGASDFSMGTF